MTQGTIATLGLCLLLAGCGGSQGGDQAAGSDGKVAAAASGWDATDACDRLDKAAVGTALGDTVTETSLAFVHQSMGSDASTSECTYQLAGGGKATLMTRNSPIADNTPEVMAMTKKTTAGAMAAFSSKPIEDVPGLGISAFFVPGINQMNVFLDDRRFVVLTIDGAPADKAKQIAADLVRKVAG